jgi:hypothetical protein
VPGKSPGKVQSEILDINFSGELQVVYMDFDLLAFILHLYSSLGLQLGLFAGVVS